MVETVGRYAEKTGLAVERFVAWLGVARSTFFAWRRRHGKANEHNASLPRGHWILPWERQAIVKFHGKHPDEGCRRLAYRMLDQDVAAVSPSTTYRVLKAAGVLRTWNAAASSKKGTGFEQPTAPHEHWHADISYLNIRGTFFYLCSVLDGYSRAILSWDIRPAMTEADVEIVLQGAVERYPLARARLISDNGPQFLAKDFKEFLRHCEMTHVRTSPYYPQSNGKSERVQQTIKRECIRPQTPLSLEEAKRIVAAYVEHYNRCRLHSAIGYVAPFDKLHGREERIFAERKRKLQDARRQREQAHRDGASVLTTSALKNNVPATGETDAGSAGEQPARDSRPGFRRQTRRGDGPKLHPRPSGDRPEIPPMPQKTHLRPTLNLRSAWSNSG